MSHNNNIFATDEALDRIRGDEHLLEVIELAVESGLPEGSVYYVCEFDEDDESVVVTLEPLKPGILAAIITPDFVQVH
jgi:hypothetical protein